MSSDSSCPPSESSTKEEVELALEDLLSEIRDNRRLFATFEGGGGEGPLPLNSTSSTSSPPSTTSTTSTAATAANGIDTDNICSDKQEMEASRIRLYLTTLMSSLSSYSADTTFEFPESCAARRLVQKGNNICEACHGKFETCHGSYGMRTKNGSGIWSHGTSSDLNSNPESPNKRWCCAGCEANASNAEGNLMFAEELEVAVALASSSGNNTNANAGGGGVGGGENKKQKMKAYYLSKVAGWLERYDSLVSTLSRLESKPSSSSLHQSTSARIPSSKICSICQYPIESIFDSVCYCFEPVDGLTVTANNSITSVPTITTNTPPPPLTTTNSPPVPPFATSATANVVTASSPRHPRCHNACMISYIESSINLGYVGNCAKVYCPEVIHSESRGANHVRLPFSKWSKVVSEATLTNYNKMAEGFMHFLCGQCHTSKSTLLSFDLKGEETLNKYLVEKMAKSTLMDHNICCRNGHVLQLIAKSSPWTCDARSEEGGCVGPSSTGGGLPRYRCNPCDFDYCGPCYTARFKALPPKPHPFAVVMPPSPIIPDMASFMSEFAKFQLGKISAAIFYNDLLQIHAPDYRSKSDKDVWELVKIVIQMISDPERRAALQLYHFNTRPRFLTTCCNKEHCFKCKTKDFHSGKSCAENISSLDSSVLPCPNCKVHLAKSDGCDSVSCVCGHKFAWKQALILYNHVFKFSADFPTDTAQASADVLCGLVENVSHENAMYWRNHEQNQALVDRLIFKSWIKRFPLAPFVMVAKCLSDPALVTKLNIHNVVFDILNAAHKDWIEAALTAIKLSKKISLDCMYPTMEDKFVAFSSLMSVAKSDLSVTESDTQNNLVQLKNSNIASWTRIAESAVLKSAKQFLLLFGSNSIATVYQRRDSVVEAISDHFWGPSGWCDANLEFSTDKLCAKRPGGISSYPAAFAKMEGVRDSFKVVLLEAGSTTNSISFGVSLVRSPNSSAISIPLLSSSGSDGVGRSQGTFGVIEDRGSSQPAKVYSDKNLVSSWRKLKAGDVLSANVDLESLTCQISLNGDEFTQILTLVPGQYCFAMTFANDHKVRILNEDDSVGQSSSSSSSSSSGNSSSSSAVGQRGDIISQTIASSDKGCANLRLLNTFHWKLLSDFRKLLKAMNTMDSMNDDGNSLTSSEEFKSMVSNAAAKSSGSKSLTLSPDFISSTIEKLLSSNKKFDVAPSEAQLDSSITWSNLFDGTCMSLLDAEQRNRELEEFSAYQFYEIWGESAAFEAARILIPNSPNVTKEEVRHAKAFAKIMRFLLEEWYDYNSTLSESLIPELQKTSKSCRCVPRCIGSSCAAERQ